MTKTRKTRAQKIKTQKRRDYGGFQIKKEWIELNKKKTDHGVNFSNDELGFFKSDLTRTFVLTMLILALEAGLWFLQR